MVALAVPTNRFWQLNARPLGIDFGAALSLETEPLPEPGAGEVLIRTDWISLDAGTRMWMTARTDSYMPPIPLGSKMAGLCLGRVTASRAKGVAEGDLVRAFGQWADHALVDPAASGLMRVDEDIDPRQHFGALGMNAWTAYGGLTEIARVQPGETVLVSAAAGATGSLACQIARNLGARVIGIAGGAAKCAYLRDGLGVDQAIDYKADDVAAALASVDGGIHVYFDNVGGPMLDAVLPAMALHGRIAVCGMIAVYDSEAPLPGPAHYDQVLMKRLRIEGFLLPDFMERAAGFYPKLRRWLEAGTLDVRFDETPGLENVLTAYGRLMTGANTGKVIVDLRR
jgi:NADPH-dependent curcumin reductase CurA